MHLVTEPTLQQRVEAYIADPTDANREAAVLHGVRLVRSLVGRVSLPDTPLATRDDLEGAALIGLLQALDSYDPARAMFSTHAHRRIQGAIVDYLRDIDPLSRGKRQKMAQAQRAHGALQQMLGDEPTDEDVADYMGIGLDEYHAVLGDAQVRFTLSYDAPLDEESGVTRGETLADDGAQAGFDAFEQSTSLDAVAELIRHLPKRERDILSLYYFEDLTLREIGGIIGLTEARISQILGKTLLGLRSNLTSVRAAA
jgi:RNA polymerase sigma factor for flagellar operon FliA